MEHTEYPHKGHPATEGAWKFLKDAIAAIRELEPLQAEVEQPSNPAHKGPWQLWHAIGHVRVVRLHPFSGASYIQTSPAGSAAAHCKADTQRQLTGRGTPSVRSAHRGGIDDESLAVCGSLKHENSIGENKAKWQLWK